MGEFPNSRPLYKLQSSSHVQRIPPPFPPPPSFASHLPFYSPQPNTLVPYLPHANYLILVSLDTSIALSFGILSAFISLIGVLLSYLTLRATITNHCKHNFLSLIPLFLSNFTLYLFSIYCKKSKLMYHPKMIKTTEVMTSTEPCFVMSIHISLLSPTPHDSLSAENCGGESEMTGAAVDV